QTADYFLFHLSFLLGSFIIVSRSHSTMLNCLTALILSQRRRVCQPQTRRLQSFYQYSFTYSASCLSHTRMWFSSQSTIFFFTASTKASVGPSSSSSISRSSSTAFTNFPC